MADKGEQLIDLGHLDRLLWLGRRLGQTIGEVTGPIGDRALRDSYLSGNAPLIVAVQIQTDCLSADALFVPYGLWVWRVATPTDLAQVALATRLRHTTFDLAFASLTVGTCYHRTIISCLLFYSLPSIHDSPWAWVYSLV